MSRLTHLAVDCSKPTNGPRKTPPPRKPQNPQGASASDTAPAESSSTAISQAQGHEIRPRAGYPDPREMQAPRERPKPTLKTINALEHKTKRLKRHVKNADARMRKQCDHDWIVRNGVTRHRTTHKCANAVLIRDPRETHLPLHLPGQHPPALRNIPKAVPLARIRTRPDNNADTPSAEGRAPQAMETLAALDARRRERGPKPAESAINARRCPRKPGRTQLLPPPVQPGPEVIHDQRKPTADQQRWAGSLSTQPLATAQNRTA